MEQKHGLFTRIRLSIIGKAGRKKWEEKKLEGENKRSERVTRGQEGNTESEKLSYVNCSYSICGQNLIPNQELRKLPFSWPFFSLSFRSFILFLSFCFVSLSSKLNNWDTNLNDFFEDFFLQNIIISYLEDLPEKGVNPSTKWSLSVQQQHRRISNKRGIIEWKWWHHWQQEWHYRSFGRYGGIGGRTWNYAKDGTNKPEWSAGLEGAGWLCKIFSGVLHI